MRRATIILVAALATAPGHSAMQPVPSLRAEEVFVQQPGLTIALQAPRLTLRVGQDPQFALRFHNRGAAVLYLNPDVAPNLRVTRPDGSVVPAPVSGITARAAPRLVRPGDLIALAPGRDWVVPIYAVREDQDRVEIYTAAGQTKKAGSGILLPPGNYVARFTYINAPDHFTNYDPYEMPRALWEGRLEAAPLAFTVTVATPRQLAAEIRRLGSDAQPVSPLLSMVSWPLPRLVEEFLATSGNRYEVVQVARMRGERLAPAVIEAIGRLPAIEQQAILYSYEFSALLREQADCAILSFLAGQLHSTRGAVLAYLQPVFERLAPQCAEVRDRLRAMVADASELPYARSAAAALLGTFHNPADVPLLIEALQGGASRNDDPIPDAAATGLALIGGQSADEALGRRLLAALSSPNANTVLTALSSVRSGRSDGVAARVLELLTHPNPTIRSYAAHAIRRTAGREALAAMRTAVRDRDENVQQEAVFFLAEHGTSADLDAFLHHLDSRNQYVREAAAAGVKRFGTAESFSRVRQLVDDPREEIRFFADDTLGALTFVTAWPRRTGRQWDDWYSRHRNASRQEWAREAIGGLTNGAAEERRWKLSAIGYLADYSASAFRQDFESAATSRQAAVRVEAARAIAHIDRSRAAALLVREFDGRLISGCELARRALSEVSGEQRPVDCTDPAERRRARSGWSH